MTGFPKWLMHTSLVTCVALFGIQAVRASRLSRQVGVAERARQEAEEYRVKSLEPIIRAQRYELLRFRLQLKALGNPPLPYIGPEELERAEREEITKTSRPPIVQPANRKLPPRPPMATAE